MSGVAGTLQPRVLPEQGQARGAAEAGGKEQGGYARNSHPRCTQLVQGYCGAFGTGTFQY